MAIATSTGISGTGSIVPGGSAPPPPKPVTNTPPPNTYKGPIDMSINNTQQGADLVNANQAQAAKMGINLPGSTYKAPTTDTSTSGTTSKGTTDTSGTSGTTTSTDTSGTSSTSGTTIDANTRATIDKQNAADAAFQAQAQHVQDTITNIQNGTTPLTAGEQAQIDGLKAQFQHLIDQQTLQNTNASGVANIRGYQTGAAEYDPTFQAKTIGGIVAAGNAKIADLNTKMASAVAQMTQSFHDNDIKAVTDAWKLYNDAATEHAKTLSDTITETQNAIKNAQDQAQKAEDNARADEAQRLTEMMDNNTISYQAKQQALAQAQLDEKTKMDIQTLADEKLKNNIDLANLALNQQKEKFAESGAGGISIAGLPQVSMNASNKPDPTAQATFLSNLNPDVATLVKGIANYSINPNSIPTRQFKGSSGMTQQQMLALVAQYDPTYDSKEYANRQALQKNFQSGKYSQNINSLNTAIGHLVDLQSNTQGLGNAGFTPYNVAKNTVENLFGAGNIARASTNINAAVSELATTFKGSGATDAEIKNLGSVDANSSPEQVKAYVETATQLLASRLNALEETYTQGMGKAPNKSFLSDTAAQGLLKLQQNGYNIQVPQLAQTPQVKLQTFHDSDPKAAAMLDQLVQADPSLKSDPNKMIDLLNANGIQL